jgi:hypothetical protein
MQKPAEYSFLKEEIGCPKTQNWDIGRIEMGLKFDTFPSAMEDNVFGSPEMD